MATTELGETRDPSTANPIEPEPAAVVESKAEPKSRERRADKSQARTVSKRKRLRTRRYSRFGHSKRRGSAQERGRSLATARARGDSVTGGRRPTGADVIFESGRSPRQTDSKTVAVPAVDEFETGEKVSSRRSKSSKAIKEAASATPQIPPETKETEATEVGPVAATEAENAFLRAWNLHRAGRHEEAARYFERASSLGEDALYWKALSWAQTKNTSEAHRALSQYVSRYRGSARSYLLCALLGWSSLKRGQLEEAAEQFRYALKSTEDSTRKSAKAGLAEVSKRRN